MLNPHPLLVPWSRKGRAISLLPLWAVRPVQSLSRAISLLPLWAVQPVQGLSACTRVHFKTIHISFMLHCLPISSFSINQSISYLLCDIYYENKFSETMKRNRFISCPADIYQYNRTSLPNNIIQYHKKCN
jgi:hypothetical protein